MRNHHAGAAHGVQRLRDLLLRLVVQRAGGLVEQQELRLRRDGPGDHQPLLLPAGDPAAALGYHRIHTHGHGADVVGDARLFRRVPRLVDGEAGRSENDVGINVALEQAALLHDGADLPAQGAEIETLDVLVVVVDRSLLRLFKAQQEAHERGFSAARPADDGHVFAWSDLEREVVQDVWRIFIIAEADMAELYAAVNAGDDRFLLLRFRHGFEKRLRHLQDRFDLRTGRRRAGQHGKRAHQRAVGRRKSEI